jgi:8-oxo-dGTP pyrophosphatase MutT (NUDIX family)
MSELRNVPEDKNLGWNFNWFYGKATVSDDKGNQTSGSIVSIDEVKYASLESKFGKLTMGFNGFYGQWAFEENGGVVVIPYSVSPEGELFLAGGYEKRLLIDDGVEMFTPPGGFGLNSESAEDTGKRETLEETGIHVNNLINIGNSTPNRAFWIKNPDGNWPLTFMACKVDWTTIAEKDGQYFIPSTEGAIAELDKLSKLIFLPAIDAISNTNDGIAVTAYAKTLAAFYKGIIS